LEFWLIKFGENAFFGVLIDKIWRKCIILEFLCKNLAKNDNFGFFASRIWPRV
jgi:hypothetical protein